jgi:hypothetical protein
MASFDSFNRVARAIPDLIVLNDDILTSQFRGFIAGVAEPDPGSLIRVSRNENYIFDYMRYIQGGQIDRAIRRFRAEMFAVNRVLRRSSDALKIQCRYRGMVARREYRDILRAGRFLNCVVHWWLTKWAKRARVIQRTFRRFLQLQKQKKQRSARAIQIAWRRYIARIEFLSVLFAEKDETCDVYLSPDSLELLRAFAAENQLWLPTQSETTEYKLIKLVSRKRKRLPGSPIVLYNCEEEVIIRKAICHAPPTESIWCLHHHEDMQKFVHISKFGVNFSHICPFAALPWAPPQRSAARRSIFRTYPRLEHIHFPSIHVFMLVLRALLKMGPSGIRFFCKDVLERMSAQLSLHSCLRSIVTRSRYFPDMKRQAIESRANRTILKFTRRMRLLGCCQHVNRTVRYRDSLSRSQIWFVTNEFYENVGNYPRLHPLSFGYNRHQGLAIANDGDTTHWFGRLLDATDVIVNPLSTLSSLLYFNVRPFRATPLMFYNEIPLKWLKYLSILRLTFSSGEEAMKRQVAFGFITGVFTEIMDTKMVRELCAAVVIKRAIRRYSLRREFRHQLHPPGRVTRVAPRPQPEAPQRPQIRQSFTEQQVVTTLTRTELPPDEAIHQLRGDYRPWEEFPRPPPRKPRAEPEPQPEPLLDFGIDNDSVDPRIVLHTQTATVLPFATSALSRTRPTGEGPSALINLGRERTPRRFGTVRPKTETGRRPTSRCLFSPEDTSQTTEMTVKHASSQVTTHAQEIARQHAVTRLIKLRHLGNEIEGMAVVDHELERTRALKSRVSTQIKRGRAERKLAAATWREESCERNVIENTERTQAAREVKERVRTTRQEETRRVRTAHATRLEKFHKEKEFAIHFVNASRQLSHLAETRHRKEEEKKVFAKAHAVVEAAHQESKEMKERHKNTAREIGQRKRDAASQQRMLVEEKRKWQDEEHVESMDRIREWKKSQKAIMEAVKEVRKIPRFFYPNAAPALETDEAEGAALCITGYIGENIGEIEARLMVEMIARMI